MKKLPEWLKDAVFYEIYPQSFFDTNNDGIGDFNGIIEKLDYVKSLGANALWINPCYDSPFKDAGYDVRDYKKIAPRYGTNEDAKRLFEEAHKRNIHVLFDLVPGHTSEEHEWFRKSSEVSESEYDGRYIWTEDAFDTMPGHLYVSGDRDRNGCYMLNFFKCQPALNYGFLEPKEYWQDSTDSENARSTIEAVKDVMRFWLDMGLDGFRVDMADSLVKDDDEQKNGTSAIWREVREMLDKDYPNAALVSEWSNPCLAINNANYHMDFLLDHCRYGYNFLVREYEESFFNRRPVEKDRSYFRKDSGSDITFFLSEYLSQYLKTKDNGYISIISGNHDTPRLARNLDASEIKLFFALQMTFPGVPFIYYGDEIGMRYLDLDSKEGGYRRTGTRTPMQWNGNTGENCGFSDATREELYLPVDDGSAVDLQFLHPDDRSITALKKIPNVKDQENDPGSLLNTLRKLTALRHENIEDLGAEGYFGVIFAEKDNPLFIYRRGNLICMLNPSEKSQSAVLTAPVMLDEYKSIFSLGNAGFAENTVNLGPQSFAVLKKK